MLGRPLIRLDSVGSTMTVLAGMATAGASEGTTVVTDYQTAGRGRADRQWHAPAGTALLSSVLLRPQMPLGELSALSILVADAICSGIEGMLGLQTMIKWPNDVLIEGRKISGVLIQTRAQRSGIAVVVGMGINVNVSHTDIPSTGTSLLVEYGSRVDRDILLTAILDELDQRYREFLTRDMAGRWELIQRRLAMRDEIVSVQEGETRVTGVLKGVASDGVLLLDTGEGIKRVVVGDLSRGPKLFTGADRGA